MKKITFHFSILIVLLAISFSNDKINQPQPKNGFEPGESKDKQKLLEWIEEMHAAPEGVNWKEMDLQTRYKNYLGSQSTPNFRASESNWNEIGSNNQSGRIHVADVDFSSNQIYCASSGGNIWKGDLDGKNWECLNNNFRISDIILLKRLKKIQKRIVTVTSKWSTQKVYYSENDGKTWKVSKGDFNTISWGNISKAVVSNDKYNSVYILTMEWDYTKWKQKTCLYKSIDKASTFNLIREFPTNTGNVAIWSDSYGKGALYILDDKLLYRYSDNKFDTVNTNITIINSGVIRLTGKESKNNTDLYLLVAYSGKSDIYHSPDAGTNWYFKSTLNESPFMSNSFNCSSVAPEVLYFGGVNCYRSINNAASWEKINNWGEYYGDPLTKLHADIPGINSFIDPKGKEFILISTDGGIYKSTNSLETVENISLNKLNVSQYYSTYTSPINSTLYIGSQDQGFQKAIIDNGNYSFSQLISGDYGHIVSSDQGQNVWIVYPGFTSFCPNGNPVGPWWDFSGNKLTGQLWIPPIIADPLNNKKIYLGGGGTSGGAHIFTITYDNTNISHLENSFDFSFGKSDINISALGISPLNNNNRYILTNKGRFFYSYNGGNTWDTAANFAGPESHYFYGSSILPSKTNPNIIYIAGSGYAANLNPVYISKDNGKTFSNYSNGLPKTLVFGLAASDDDKILFAATEVGPYMCDTKTNQWEFISGGPDQVYWSVEYVSSLKAARFGTYGRGIWDFYHGGAAPYLSVSDKQLTITYLNNSKLTANISSNVNWELSCDQTWIHLNNSTGTNDASIEIIADENPNLLSRVAMITVKGEGVFPVEITIIQAGNTLGLENPLSFDLKIFPVPTRNTLFISNIPSNSQIFIYNMDGKLVVSKSISGNTIDLSDLKNGQYLLQVKSGNKVLKGKFVKE